MNNMKNLKVGDTVYLLTINTPINEKQKIIKSKVDKITTLEKVGVSVDYLIFTKEACFNTNQTYKIGKEEIPNAYWQDYSKDLHEIFNVNYILFKNLKDAKKSLDYDEKYLFILSEINNKIFSYKKINKIYNIFGGKNGI